MLRSSRRWATARLAARLTRLLRPFYRLTYLAAASRSGLLKRLSLDRVPFEELAAELAPHPHTREALRAWLDTGVSLGLLTFDIHGYGLEPTLTTRLADVTFDAFAALTEEAVTLHHRLLLDTPGRIRAGRLYTLDEHDPNLVARASRVVAGLVDRAVAARVPPQGPVRILDVGCGLGAFLRTALGSNPEATGVGVERQAELVVRARRNLHRWNLASRARIVEGDVRDLAPRPEYDLVLLLNAIYYIPLDERLALLRHLHGFLRPGGRILVVTPCLSRVPEAAILNLWATSTQGCGRLPALPEMRRSLEQAGFASVRATRLLPALAAFDGLRRR